MKKVALEISLFHLVSMGTSLSKPREAYNRDEVSYPGATSSRLADESASMREEA